MRSTLAKAASTAALLFGAAAAAGEPRPLVAMGGGFVVSDAPAPEASGAPDPAGWVAVLADCLDERAPAGFAVMGRAAVEGPIPGGALVVVGVREAPDGLGARLDRTLGVEAGGPDASAEAGPVDLLLVGPVAPLAHDPPEQAALDDRARAVDAAVAALATARGARHVALSGHWPTDRDERAPLTSDGHLTPQGHARVAAVVCDAVVAWDTAQ